MIGDRLRRWLAGSGAVRPPASSKALDSAGAWVARGNLALDEHRLDEAARCYEQALGSQPDSVASLVGLAHVLGETGRHEQASSHLHRVLSIDADNVDAHFMLGQAARTQHQSVLAARHFEKAAELRPDFALAYAQACQAWFESGDAVRAVDVATKGLVNHPQSIELLMYRGNLYLNECDAARALTCYSAACEIRSDVADVHANAALAHRMLGNAAAAAGSLRSVVALRPGDAKARLDLATCLQELGQPDAAILELRRAIEADVGLFAAHLNLGTMLQERGDIAGAIRSYRAALTIDQDSAAAHCNLGTAFAARSEDAAAMSSYERALRSDPCYVPAFLGMAVQYNDQGLPDKAAEVLRQALVLDPEHLDARSKLLFMLSFALEPLGYVDEARRYGHTLSRMATVASHADVGVPQVLRIGFVSGDLRRHPVAFFIEDVLVQLRQRPVKLFAYTTSSAADDMTARIRPLFDGWRSIVGMSDAVATQCIRDDEVHILIDLSGHTANNRLPVFARKPAPLQVTWLGYLASTGVSAIDYVLADRVSFPSSIGGQFTEDVWYLPNSLYCFSPPTDAPEVSPLPARRSGRTTFGSFQRLNKVSEPTLMAWAQILELMPEATLRYQNKQMADDPTRRRFIERLEAAGVPVERVVFAGAVNDRNQYLGSYEHVDIVLDTFPYPGITTTCEALWMGVPTVTLAGSTLLARQGASLLACVDLQDWVACDADAYVHLAVEHARNLSALEQLRDELRPRARRSPLFDARRFARDLEEALRGMWRTRKT